MTVMDMIVLADMWKSLSEGSPGTTVEKLVLPGNLTGRDSDRYFSCSLRPGTVQWDGVSGWSDYLEGVVQSVDFEEVRNVDWAPRQG